MITTAKEHDRNQLEVLVDDKEAMYVFDRGYVDYERFDRMTDDGYFFVSRLKKTQSFVKSIHFHFLMIVTFYPIKWSILVPHKIVLKMSIVY